MKSLFGEEIIVSKPEFIGTSPCEQTIFLVATWYSPCKRWKLWRTEFYKADEAKKWADDITTKGHSHYVILQIKFPSEQPAKAENHRKE